MWYQDATLGWTIGLPIWVILLVATPIITGLMMWADPYNKAASAFWGALAWVGVLVIGMWIAWPLDSDYHHYRDVGGTVERVNKRMVPSGENSMEEKVVVQIDGNPYGVKDTRGALLEKGDKVKLRCVKAYDFGSPVHGWDCKWAGQ